MKETKRKVVLRALKDQLTELTNSTRQVEEEINACTALMVHAAASLTPLEQASIASEILDLLGSSRWQSASAHLSAWKMLVAAWRDVDADEQSEVDAILLKKRSGIRDQQLRAAVEAITKQHSGKGKALSLVAHADDGSTDALLRSMMHYFVNAADRQELILSATCLNELTALTAADLLKVRPAYVRFSEQIAKTAALASRLSVLPPAPGGVEMEEVFEILMPWAIQVTFKVKGYVPRQEDLTNWLTQVKRYIYGQAGEWKRQKDLPPHHTCFVHVHLLSPHLTTHEILST